MSTDKVLVFSICLVMILVISVMIMEYIVMINLKIDYDLMCRKYFWLAEMNGGLSTEERTELRELLENRNYSDVSIESPIGIKFGEDFSIKISAKREFSFINGLYSRAVTNTDFVFEKMTISRRISN